MVKYGDHTQSEPARTPPPGMRPVTPIDVQAGLAATVEPTAAADEALDAAMRLNGMGGVAWAMQQAISTLTICRGDADRPYNHDVASLRDAAALLHSLAVELNDMRPDGLPRELGDQIEGLCTALHLALHDCEGDTSRAGSVKAIGCAIPALRTVLEEASGVLIDKACDLRAARVPEGVAA